MQTTPIEKKQFISLTFITFIAGICSIIYELLIATATSYFMGDSVKYFSLTIGLYMAAMGIGSYISRFMTHNILHKFFLFECLLALLGGLSVPILYYSYAYLDDDFVYIYILLTLSVGFLIGLEIPFLSRLIEQKLSLKDNLAHILTLDYFGALLATLAFPFIMLPFFGVYQSSIIFGLVNITILIFLMYSFKIDKYAKIFAYSIIFILSLSFLFSNMFLHHWDSILYEDRIVFSKQTPYQNLVLTQRKDDIRLFINGDLQFASIDEYRYHETLVHTPISYMQQKPKTVLLLGAGDGLAVRELLKYKDIGSITLVDLDPAMTELAKHNPHLLSINQNAMNNSKVNIIHNDAFKFLNDNHTVFDLIIADLPDPNNEILARLYSKQFYKLIYRNLSENGAFITQAVSPISTREAFWVIFNTVKTIQFHSVIPLNMNVPSFGEWGFVMAFKGHNLKQATLENLQYRYLNQDIISNLSHFSNDISYLKTQINIMDRPILLEAYINGWEKSSR